MGILRPPVIRSAIGVLDRSLFKKTVNLAAAAVADRKKISAWRQKLQGDHALLAAERIPGVVPHPDQALASQGTKCLLLDPKIKVGGNVRATGVPVVKVSWLLTIMSAVPETWTPILRGGVTSKEVGVVSYDLFLDYDYWSYGNYTRLGFSSTDAPS